MNDTHWPAVEEVFEAAIELPASQRASLLDRRCGADAALRAQVESLLVAHDQSTGFLTPLGTAPDDPPTPDAFGVGSQVGAYRLIEELGRGGMGTVFLATRADGEFSHRVAIKITRSALGDRELARRFQAERQILASLRHPNIVSLVDGGTTATGHGYLAMEYVEGKPITTWVREVRGSLEQRLRMFRQVCSAVHAAHQNGIVHRDLKPANILVDGTGLPKVLDFGIAKLTEGGQDEGTQDGLFAAPLTPNYASPEQLRGLPVTTASDVYALGVLLYELVAGMRPYETSGRPLDEVLNEVLRGRVRRASAGAWLSAADLPYSSERLRGDIDAIVARAMAVEPAQRYASAEELSADVARFLGGKPVLAQEPSAGYLLRKLARQHRAAVGVACAGVLLLLAVLGIALWQRQVALQQHAIAEARFDDVRQLANSLIFKIHDEVAKVQGSTEVRKVIVDEALKYLDTLARNSDDESLKLELARGYKQVARAQGDPQSANLGDRDGAIANLGRSLDILKPMLQSPRLGGAASYEAIHAYRVLAGVYGAIGRREDAIAASSAALALAERWVRSAPGNPEAQRALGSAYFNLALATRPHERALPYWTESGRVFQQLLDEKPDDLDRMRNVALVHKYTAGSLEEVGRRDEAAEHYRQALALDEQRLAARPNDGTTQFDVAIDLANMGHVLLLLGQDAYAIEYYERSVAMREGLAERDPKNVLATIVLGRVYAITALVYHRASDMPRAADRAGRAIETLESRVAGSADREPKRYLAAALYVRGAAAQHAGNRDRACADWRRALALVNEVGPDAVRDADVTAWAASLQSQAASCAP